MLMSWDDGCIMFDTVEDFAKTWEHVRRLGTSHMPVILGLYDGFTAAFIPVYRMSCMRYAHIPDVHDSLCLIFLYYSCHCDIMESQAIDLLRHHHELAQAPTAS